MLTRSAKRHKIAEDEAAASKATDDKSSVLATRSTNGCDFLKAATATDSTAKRNLTLNYMLPSLLASFTELHDAGMDLDKLWADAIEAIAAQHHQEMLLREMSEDRHDSAAIRDLCDRLNELLRNLNEKLWGYQKASGMMRRASHDVGLLIIR